MKLSRELLKKIVKEELEQEGLFGTLKAKIAPGMAAKSVASSIGDMFTVNKDGVIDITPGQIRGSDFNNVNDRVLKYTSSMIKNPDFQALPEKSKKLILKYNKAAKEGKADGIQSALDLVPPGSQFEKMLRAIKSGQDAAAADAASAAYERETSARRDRNDYEARKNAELDAELARQRDRESFERELRMAQYEPPESRAARPEDRGGMTTVYSSTPRGNVRDAWEESKKLKQNDLVKMIKEEFHKMMQETEQFPTDYDKDQKRKNKDYTKDYFKDISGDEYNADEEKAKKKKDKEKGEKVDEVKYDAMIGRMGGGTDERPSRGQNSAARFADLEDKLDSLEAKLKKAEGAEKESIQSQIKKVRQQMRDLD